MSSVVISGDTSGAVTISAPAVAGTTTLTLPATSGTILQSGTAVTEAQGGTGTTTGYYGFKNRIINGAMVIDQRNAGASQTFTAAAALAYSVDRWYGYCTGANVTGQQVAGSTSPTNTQFRYRFTGAASVTAVGFGQRIEQKNSYDLAGSTCTLSADLAISATLTTVTWTAYYATTTADTFGSLASPTVTQIATGTFTVSATVTNFSANISVPAAATTGIQILFTVGALTAGLTWTVGNVQLEKGSTATSFDYRDYGREFIMCQRYFQLVYPTAGNATTSTVADMIVSCFTPMRTNATLNQTGVLTVYDDQVGPFTQSSTSITNLGNSNNVVNTIRLSNFSGMTANRFLIGSPANPSNYVSLSAEL